MYDFIRIATLVPRLKVGNVKENTEQIIKMLEEADGKKVDVAVLPELSVTGYTCADLFFQTTLQNAAKSGLIKILEETKKMDLVAVVGLPLVIEGQLYNCAAVLYDGKVCAIVPKTFIPNYVEFSEKRWFSSSDNLRVTSIKACELGISSEYDIPVGRNIIFAINNSIKFGIEICEDLLVPIANSGFLALNGAEIILNLSASSEVATKREYRKNLVKMQSASLICGYVYVSSGSDESTTDLVFSGQSIIAENGKILAENEKKIDNDYLLIQEIDVGKIKSDRIKNNCFNDSRSLFGKHEPCININIKKDIKGNGNNYSVNKMPFVPTDKSERYERCMEIFEIQAAGLKKRLSVTGCRPIIGVSGGLDSTLAMLVAVKAIKDIEKPLSDIVGITMPCFGTSDRTYNNAKMLMQGLGITHKEINIKESTLKHFSDIGHDKNILDLTYENAQARERTQVLMDYAGQVGGMVVGTGDLSELALGWCTYNGDHMSMYGVNSGVPKTLIPFIIESIIESKMLPDCAQVLRDIVDTPISPELLPPDREGDIVQKTEDIVGPYALHDFFLYNIIRYGFEPVKIYYLAKKAFNKEYDDESILKWLKNFYRRFFSQQFKRNCVPDGVKVGSVGLSPRGDWKMPSDASFEIWLDEVMKL